MDTPTHLRYMRMALQQAGIAMERGEVPTGCVIIKLPDQPDGLPAVVGRAHNQTELLKDPTAHAEILAITQTAAAVGDWRLTNTVLYVTKEPCAMCAGAIILARIPTVVYGVSDPLRGGASVFGILNHTQLNHRCRVVTGILEEECRAMLQNFFRIRRNTPDAIDEDTAPPL